MRGGMTLKNELRASIREIVFGLEDSLVSTLGAVTGIAAGTGNAFVVILSGTVLIFVEALSMSAGSYLSSKSAAEVLNLHKKQDLSRLLQGRISEEQDMAGLLREKGCSDREVKQITSVFEREREVWVKELQRCEVHYAPSASNTPVRAAFVMGIFYLFGGLFPLAPYFLLPPLQAIAPSIFITAVLLFGLGYWKGQIVQGNKVKSALEMTAISLTAAALGFMIGRAVSIYFGIDVV